MIAQRILAVFAAILLVIAVGLATLGPGTITLGRVLFELSPDLPDGLHHVLSRILGGWLWDDVAMPLIVRPAWLLPASFGLILIGLSVSVSNRKSTHRSHRRS